jgi:hypothetical protein
MHTHTHTQQTTSSRSPSVSRNQFSLVSEFIAWSSGADRAHNQFAQPRRERCRDQERGVMCASKRSMCASIRSNHCLCLYTPAPHLPFHSPPPSNLCLYTPVPQLSIQDLPVRRRVAAPPLPFLSLFPPPSLPPCRPPSLRSCRDGGLA